MWKVRFTPMLKLAANTMPVCSAAAAMAALPASSKPVVPITILMPRSAQRGKRLPETLGRVKSMSTSQLASTVSMSLLMATPVFKPEAWPASKPKASEPACSSAPVSTVCGLAATASTSTLPMRPFTPARATLMVADMIFLKRDYCAAWPAGAACCCCCLRNSSNTSPSALTRESFASKYRVRFLRSRTLPPRLTSKT